MYLLYGLIWLDVHLFVSCACVYIVGVCLYVSINVGYNRPLQTFLGGKTSPPFNILWTRNHTTAREMANGFWLERTI